MSIFRDPAITLLYSDELLLLYNDDSKTLFWVVYGIYWPFMEVKSSKKNECTNLHVYGGQDCGVCRPMSIFRDPAITLLYSDELLLLYNDDSKTLFWVVYGIYWPFMEVKSSKKNECTDLDVYGGQDCGVCRPMSIFRDPAITLLYSDELLLLYNDHSKTLFWVVYGIYWPFMEVKSSKKKRLY